MLDCCFLCFSSSSSPWVYRSSPAGSSWAEVDVIHWLTTGCQCGSHFASCSALLSATEWSWCVQMSFMRTDQNNFSWHFIWLLVLSVSDKVLLSVLMSNVSFNNRHLVFDSAGNHSSVQEDAQIRLWKTLTGVQTGVLRPTGECVEHRNWCLCELWCFWLHVSDHLDFVFVSLGRQRLTF